MPEKMTKSQDEGSAPASPWRSDLPRVQVPIAPDEVVARLQRSSQRGELPGFRAHGESQFEVSAFGTHFDRTLIGTAVPTSNSSAVTFTTRRQWKFLAIVWIVFALTLWPGVWLTHSMFLTWFGWYRLPMWGTVAWYVPLTLLCIPALFKMQRASEQASWAHAHEVIGKVATICDGKVTPPA